MSNKQALRELQGRLAQRLQSAQAEQPVRSWLAVRAGGRGFLFPLDQAGEIFPPAELQPVPHTREWFSGVANLRGGLVGVVDLAAFFGLPVGPDDRTDARLVGFNASLDIHCALLVDRLAGLKNQAALELEPPTGEGLRPAFVGGRFRDAQGGLWQEILLAALAQDAYFRNIEA